ncbi:MAG: hypothetical protein IJV68_00485 [Clostridia bacterium]|nr:hypothetical protein [Clostridia bacterium]
MQKIELKDNPLDVKVLINGVPNIHLLSETEECILISQADVIISEMFEKNEKRKKYRK